MSTYRNVSIPNCVGPLAAPLRDLVQNDKYFHTQIDVFLTTGPTVLNGQPASYYLDLSNHTGTISISSVPQLFCHGTLDGVLTRDGTQTLNLEGGGTETVDGYFIKDGYRAVSGARCGAVYDAADTTWYAIVVDECLEEVP